MVHWNALKCIVLSPVYQARIESGQVTDIGTPVVYSTSASTGWEHLPVQAHKHQFAVFFNEMDKGGFRELYKFRIQIRSYVASNILRGNNRGGFVLFKQSFQSRLWSCNRAIKCNSIGCSKRRKCKRSQNNWINAVQYTREYVINIIINNYICMVKPSKYYYIII